MGAVQAERRLTVRDLARRTEPLVALTAYSATLARLLDPHCDLILVGDSLGMVVYGLPDTTAVTVDMMIAHGAAVVRGTTRACVAVDLPFGSYAASPAQAYGTAARIVAETGCTAVKLEGGTEMAETIRFLTVRGIPVIGHVGLQPQSAHATGGFRTQGRDEAGAARILADADAVQAAGAFAVVVEAVPEPLARRIADQLGVPVIGIGASPACDGQILVTDDLLGLTPAPPRFARRYVDLAPSVTQAVERFAADVRARRFPGEV